MKELFELAVSTEGADKSVKLAAIKYIFDRIDGKPVETANMDISGVEIPVIKLPWTLPYCVDTVKRLALS